MSWYVKKGDAPPSPYRIGWTPTGEHTRWVSCPRGTRTLPAAMRFARPYASNAGLEGKLEVQELDGDVWHTLRAAPVKDSKAGEWVSPC